MFDSDGETALKINPQGDRLAYMVKSPNLATNENDVSLYVRSLSEHGSTSSKLLVTTPNVSQIIWLADGRRIAALSPVHGRIGIVLFDTESGKEEVLASSHKDIEEYSIDSNGDTVVYAIREAEIAGADRSDSDQAEGYRIPQDGVSSLTLVWRSERMPYKLRVQRRLPNGTWSVPAAVVLRSPFSGKALPTVSMSLRFSLSLSPNGLNLLLNIADIDMAKGTEVDGGDLPRLWKESPTYLRRRSSGGLIWITVLHDLVTGRTSMPFPTPGAAGAAHWAPDGSAFYVVANAPVGSDAEAHDEETNPTPGKPWHLWRVELKSSRTDQILPDITRASQAILWVENDKIGVRTGANQITTLVRGKSRWLELAEMNVSPDTASTSSDLASNGYFTALDYQRTDTPPTLLIFKEDGKIPWATIKLNPIFDEIQLASARPFHWKMLDGTDVSGTLLIPSDYQANKRYPLVIQTKPQQSDFVCDAGQSHFPSFAPQPMASQGLLYLSFSADNGFTKHFPKGYPGGIGEAVFYTDIWDSAVRELTRLNIIDPSKVGIIGFSRSGWYTEFALFRGTTRFAAATAADNVQFNLEGYWHTNTQPAILSSDAMYGGPPYGASLESWMKYSISFNLDKIHTPLLLEVMGYGVADDKIGSSPLNLSSRYEITTGLNRLKRPVELYYYPTEQHQPDHPRARLASLQRNIDWYRFWLQGYERPSPEDPGQYNRWRQMRHLQNESISANH